jgi:hypothetical protein
MLAGVAEASAREETTSANVSECYSNALAPDASAPHAPLQAHHRPRSRRRQRQRILLFPADPHSRVILRVAHLHHLRVHKPVAGALHGHTGRNDCRVHCRRRAWSVHEGAAVGEVDIEADAGRKRADGGQGGREAAVSMTRRVRRPCPQLSRLHPCLTRPSRPRTTRRRAYLYAPRGRPVRRVVQRNNIFLTDSF